MSKKLHLFLLVTIFNNSLNAQEPFLSQVYSSAQFMSPASAGSGLFQNRVQSNLRSQNLNGSSLAKTIFLGWDSHINNSHENSYNYIGVGANLISDQIMGGVLQANHFTINVASHIFLDEELSKNLSIGLGLTFSQANIKFDQLKFGDQFFDGEFTFNSQSKSLQYLNSNATNLLANSGLQYTVRTKNKYFQIGASAFFYIKPELSKILNNNQAEKLKSFLFLNYEKEIFEKKSIMLHASYNTRNNISQLIFGGLYGTPFGSYYIDDNRLYIGCFYRIKDAIIPNITLIVNKYRFGLSYDIYNSELSKAQLKPSAFEISLSAIIGGYRRDVMRTLFD